MQILLIKPKKIYKYPFPSDNVTKYWINDYDLNGNERELIAIENNNNSWNLLSNDSCEIEINGNVLNQVVLSLNSFYYLKIKEGEINNYALLFIQNDNDTTFKRYEFSDGEYKIGKNDDQNIVLNSPIINENHAVLEKNKDGFHIKAVDSNYGVYVNKERISSKKLENGDQIFIGGYSIIVLNNQLLINNPFNNLKFNSENIKEASNPIYDKELLKTEEDDNAVLYSEDEYYSRQPRFMTSLTEENINIDNPPSKIEEDNTPILYTIGPMLTMTMTSAVSVSTSLINVANGKSTWLSSLPALIIAAAMVASTLLWPSLMRRYNKKNQKKKEKERQEKYSKYLDEKKEIIENIKRNQYQVLIENFPEPKMLQNTIINKRKLWERKINSDDFLNVRLGIGTIPLKVRLNFSQEDFSMIEDNLKEKLKELTENSKEISNSPVTINLTERNKLVLIGQDYYKNIMLKSIILQLATYHAYNDLKMVFMLDNIDEEFSEDVKILPHTWSDNKDIRFFANSYDEMSKISFYLEQVYMDRKYSDNDGKRVENDIDYKNVQPYYLLVVDNIKKKKNIEIIDKILKENKNLGFGLIIINDGISNLPNECNDFLTANGNNSGIIKNDLNTNNQQTFVMDNFDEINMGLMCEKLANIPIKGDDGFDELKSSVGFLEMYKVGRVEQLNILDRWKNNNPVNSLSVPIGLRADGELFNLDLHEKFHGPHGLIAGMTGSGKSEFIITYILSMCLNFSPEEISFVLIDYKGGGLTGAFENKLTGMKLPHLAGTITNLDTAEIKRSLSSIQSELKRRQELFNSVKAKLNESTLDIYKYQALYRSGVIDIPIPHLFIISDEFAELKKEQPEFIDELISTARIGRSLGVHLILATQKPSGIVDDQIWSNSKFRVALKVQEKSDSMDVIKCPDAVTLKKAGRFYLQVGYNDYFAIGQAAYAGTKYIPKDKVSKIVNRDITFIDNIGNSINNIETVKREEVADLGEELPNILKYICKAAKEKNMYSRQLWLDKIPDVIYVNNLINKYKFSTKPYDIKAIIGELDDPSNQRQDLLTLNFNEGGNALIYGSSNKEIMISSIIYSLIINHSSDEINIYVVDFGSEMFGTFKDAPQVGDVVFINEEEKLNNLFNSLSRELEKRKKIFSDYNGSYELYIKNSGKTLPRLIVFINNYEALSENYEDYVDVISSLSREGEKYGISFVISASGVNAISGNTTQNFNNIFALQFNDSTDYTSLFGSTHGMVPSDIEGRGLVKIDGNIYEYQTAYPYKWDEIITFIKNVCSQLNEFVENKAQKIAVLPNHVRYLDIANYITDLRNVPIGIIKESLEISSFNYLQYPISLVSSQDISILENFVPSLCQVLQNVSNTELYVIDSNELIKDSVTFKNYYSTNLDDVYDVFNNVMNNDTNKNHIFLIYGIDTFINHFDQEKGRTLKSLLSNLKNKKNVRVIIADSINKIKNYEYDDFYQNCVQSVYAIWVGSGINDQFTIKCSTYNKDTRGELPTDFGFNVNRGNANLIKTIDFYSKED